MPSILSTLPISYVKASYHSPYFHHQTLQIRDLSCFPEGEWYRIDCQHMLIVMEICRRCEFVLGY